MWNCGCDHRLFSQLCEQNDEEFNRLLMHTEENGEVNDDDIQIYCDHVE
ncbi:hypothetical protein T02_13294 [Trichinella nativa]|uniref:Uncharacterized protein n=1 Tax=Trichinella nativa TaxID=6335 RepID=A0A0V1KLX8_9BILA|nr:hypothetical protein T02_13294 [Trichinella nativa]